jgi:hypothetical protein
MNELSVRSSDPRPYRVVLVLVPIVLVALVGLVVLRIVLSPLCLLYHAVGSRPIECHRR